MKLKKFPMPQVRSAIRLLSEGFRHSATSSQRRCGVKNWPFSISFLAWLKAL
jgi:hypothetical protein